MINHRRFFFQLLLLTLLTGLVLFPLLIFPLFSPYRILSFASLLFFAALTTGIYLPSVKAALSKDRNAFTRLVMIFTFVKMFLTAALVIAYHRIYQPENNYFLIPFFLTYVVFTVFETIFMSRLGKVKAK